MRTFVGAVLLAASAAVVAVAGPAQATIYGHHDVHGAIEVEYQSLGGPSSFLGYPTTNEKPAPDGVGRYNYFTGGAIFWSPNSSAHEVHGTIRSRWTVLGGVTGVLGYPIQDQAATATAGGAYSEFQNGRIYASTATGAHEVYGSILAAYASVGYDSSSLGLPTSGEHDVTGGRRNNFQGGFIKWTPTDGAVIHYTH